MAVLSNYYTVNCNVGLTDEREAGIMVVLDKK